MAEATSKTAVRNVAPGIRGLNTVQGYRDLNPGEFVESVELTAAELKSAKETGYFRFGGKAKDEPEAPEPPEQLQNPTAAAGTGAPAPGATAGGSSDELDAMDDATLLTTAAALSGTPEAELQGKSREDLLALARK